MYLQPCTPSLSTEWHRIPPSFCRIAQSCQIIEILNISTLYEQAEPENVARTWYVIAYALWDHSMHQNPQASGLMISLHCSFTMWLHTQAAPGYAAHTQQLQSTRSACCLITHEHADLAWARVQAQLRHRSIGTGRDLRLTLSA